MGARSIGRSSTQLNLGQLQCMMLVGDHLTSKEIAKRLGISPHTVDQRIRHVLRVTGAASRREAARIIKLRVELEAQQTIPANPETAKSSGTSKQMSAGNCNARWIFPFATYRGQVNTMGPVQRIVWILLISLGAFASTAMYLAGLESLARVLRTN